MPEIGPYSLSGRLSLPPEGYRLDDLEVQVGSSQLVGDLLLDTRTVPPAATINLQARTIQLDDFKAIWLGADDADSTKKNEPDAEKSKAGDRQRRFLTDQAVLDSYDATLSLAVDEVYSGEDYLGKGYLRIVQQQGKVRFSPLHLQFPQGVV